MNDLRTRLNELAERGTPVGAETLRHQVLAELARQPSRRRVPGWAIAVAVAAVALLVIGTASLFLGGSDGSIAPSGPTDTEPVPTTTTTATPPSDTQRAGGTTLVPIDGFEPVSMSTALGDFEFVTMGFPQGREFGFPFHTTVVTPHGPVAIDESLWWSTDYLTWNQVDVDGDYGDIWLLDGDLLVITNAGDFRFVWDGSRWIEDATLDLPDSVEWIAAGPRGTVAATPTGVYFSPDGVTFIQADRGPDLSQFTASQVDPDEEEFSEAAEMDCRGTFGATEARIRTVLATEAGFVAFTSATHATDNVCSPFVWFSPDGSTWEPVSEDSPFGQASVNTLSIAEQNGRFIAIGGIEAQGRGFVWVSDDAIEWHLVDLDLSSQGMTSPLMVDAGALGWVIVGAGEGSDFALWFSPDGHNWQGPHALPEGLGIGYLVPEIVVGHDTIFGVGYREQVFVIGRLEPGPASGDASTGTVFAWGDNLGEWVTEAEMTALLQRLSLEHANTPLNGEARFEIGEAAGEASGSVRWTVGPTHGANRWEVWVHDGDHIADSLEFSQSEVILPEGEIDTGGWGVFTARGRNSDESFCIWIGPPVEIFGAQVREDIYVEMIAAAASMMLKEMGWVH